LVRAATSALRELVAAKVAVPPMIHDVASPEVKAGRSMAVTLDSVPANVGVPGVPAPR